MMKKINQHFALPIIILLFSPSLITYAQSPGYVLGPKEGEALGPTRTIKASPKSGSHGGVMVLDSLLAGFATTFHAHKRADEFFYVINGTGTVELDSLSYEINSGSVIFVPKGAVHKLKVSDNGPLNLLFFFDKPGTDEWFREAHEKYFSKSLHLSVEACNEIGKKYGYTCFENLKK